MAIRQDTIMKNANRKNMPLVSPIDMVLPIIHLISILTINNPNRINTNDFDGIK